MRFIILLGITMLMLACQKTKVDSTELQEAIVRERLAQFVDRRKEICRTAARDTALLMVDSALVTISRRLRLEGVDFPNKPNKPPFPELKEPILNDLSPLFDSLPFPDSFGAIKN